MTTEHEQVRALLQGAVKGMEPSAELWRRTEARSGSVLRRRRGRAVVAAGLAAVAVATVAVVLPARVSAPVGFGATIPELTAPLDPGTWSEPFLAPIEPRAGHTATWTGREVVVWGGSGPDGRHPTDGARLDPRRGSWAPVRAAPITGRVGHTATWTGTQVVIWGGADNLVDERIPLRGQQEDGAAYDPAADVWTVLPPAPIGGRARHTAVWTGEELLVWGGFRASGALLGDGDDALGDGAAYDPATRTWRLLPPAPISARGGHVAVWTGSEMVVWGGVHSTQDYPVDGAAYDPATARWRRIPAAPVLGSIDQAAAWTGDRLLIWGGEGESGSVVATSEGAAYDPAADRWQAIAPAPIAARVDVQGVWTGDWFVVLGGSDLYERRHEAGGAAYDPGRDVWVDLPAAPLEGREDPAVVAAGDRVLVWGGSRAPYSPLGDGAALAPPPPGGGDVLAGRVADEDVEAYIGAANRPQAVTVVTPEDRAVVYDDARRPAVAVTVAPGSTAAALDAVVLVRDGDGYRFLRLTGPADDPRAAPLPDRTQPSPDVVVPPMPVFAPDGQDLAWLEVTGEQTVLRHLSWDEGNPGAPAAVPLRTTRDDLRPVLERWFGIDQPDGTTAMTITLLDETAGREALALQRTPDGRLVIPDPTTRPGR